ncbi:hypothetical protein [Clostridium sp. UBA1652]|uniref:hypothetical protein n=1 Tax=Clostridium sp. UBA1652 TaxID=1946348 RepID=UPI0025807B6E|nr:hypothetical protein [Clostridium sp. UBA1652]
MRKLKIHKKDFIIYTIINIVALLVAMIDLTVNGDSRVLSFFPIITLGIFIFLIVRFIRIAIGNINVSENEEWFYNLYNRGCVIFLIGMCLFKIFK